MNKILVSSCFNANPLFSLAVLCPDSSKLSFVDLSGVPPSVYFRGISGLAKIPGGFVAGLQSNGPSKLLFLDEHLHYVKVIDLRLTHDVHSMVYVDGHLYIVSTGNDSVVRYDLDTSQENVVRTFAQGEFDTLHINGICSYQGRLFVSMFGTQMKKSMRLGSVVAVDTGEIVIGGLRHPHSLMTDGSSLMIVESLTGTLVRFNLEGLLDQRPGYFGYLRGVAYVANKTIVARSKKRKISRSTGMVVSSGNEPNYLSVEMPAFYVISQEGGTSEIDLSTYFDEVYDLLLLSCVGELNVIGERSSAAVRAHASAVNFLRTGDVKSSIAALESIAEPSAAQALMLSRAQFELGNLNLSWSLAQEICSHHPQFAENLHWMSKLQESLGNLELALEFAQKSVSLNAEVAGYVFQLGEMYRRLGRFDAATIQLKRAIELNPRLELAQKSLAAAEARASQHEQLGTMGTLQRLTDWRAV